MYLLILYFLFQSFFVSFFFGRLFSRKYIGFFTSICVFISFLLSIILFYEVALNSSECFFSLFNWITIDLLFLDFNFLFDSLTVSMLSVVTLISFLVHIYSIEYMKDDPHQIRFFSYISIFTFFMVILVTAGNLVQLFIGWEGVGLCSYLLINFWYSRIDANKSSIMAMVTNKVGDLCLLISFSAIFYLYNSFDYSVIFSSYMIQALSLEVDLYLFSIVGVFFILGAVGKSAQLGLHIWLPEAMEGPTPVSSLIHAATMVTAGIFLVIRCSFIFELLPSLLVLILFFGSATTFLGSSIGLFQNDIKKIIAYSTCSQLGYMFLSCGLLGYSNSIFHLINHAFFKALLFLSAGLIIYCFSHEQDFRKMGGLIYFFPFAYISILIGSLSLMGFPFFSGFYSKEKIVQFFFNLFYVSFDSYYLLNFFFFLSFLSFMSIIFTTLYSIKLLIFVFFVKYNGYRYNMFNIQYASFYMLLPLFILIYFSVFSGFFLQDMFVGAGTDFWGSALMISLVDVESISFLVNNEYIAYNTFYLFNYEYYKYLRQVPLVWVVYFSILFLFMYTLFKPRSYLFNIKYSSSFYFYIYTFFAQKWIAFNKLFFYVLIDFLFSFSFLIFSIVEKGLLEKLGPFGISSIIRKTTSFYSVTVKGLIYHYLGFMLLGLLMCIQLYFLYF
ncbi:NADH dehydrogenase subunit 5 (mitochondrion) [Naegleria fowleri]|uniref:NADH-ubiquinone oxidoreductase chain 5 n=1 Tax=Naegleria fowleri TaxID=5763 RepID=M4H5I5_NAEFO|nr:NADH dehydrogenase subunit 5 [Naegleria fowleri]AFP72305.1 NADH dehydrogenase subunit 5 [Naegleria fowleri]AOS85603.1 Nad5 [Naegleria fowleri]AOS85649.1 Nad5 [Naegleria fowleri]UAT97073.1 NADH dehydrogenase subunit 5 [Naegleria fowleri]WND64442.1 NAD(P)H-quinone oxidoreductase subunit 2, chloroplastic [Naegleria fowleri]